MIPLFQEHGAALVSLAMFIVGLLGGVVTVGIFVGRIRTKVKSNCARVTALEEEVKEECVNTTLCNDRYATLLQGQSDIKEGMAAINKRFDDHLENLIMRES